VAKKKKKNITGKTEDLPLLRTGGLINISKLRLLPVTKNHRIFSPIPRPLVAGRTYLTTPNTFTNFPDLMSLTAVYTYGVLGGFARFPGDDLLSLLDDNCASTAPCVLDVFC